MIKKSDSFIQLFFMYALLIIFSIIVIMPVLWIIFSALQPGSDLYSSSFIPKKLTLDHFKALFTQTDYLRWYWNTFIVAAWTCFFSVIITTMTAYVFSRYRFKGKKATMLTILILQMFPSFLALTAIYVIMVRLNLINNLTSLVLLYVAGGIPFNSFLVKGYFDAIPYSLDEAARVDGAGHLTIFLKVLLPITKPIIVFLALVSFTGPWMDFIFPSLLMTDPKKYTLAVGIYQWVATRANTNFTLFACGAILVAIPITLLFVFGQKYLVAGLTAGSEK